MMSIKCHCIYTDLYFGRTYFKRKEFQKYPLWLADYQNTEFVLPVPWQRSSWSIWQHTDKGRVVGIEGDVDLNRFNGNLVSFKAFINKF